MWWFFRPSIVDMSAERFTNIIGDWDTYRKYYTKTNKYLPFLKKSLNVNCTEGVCGQGGFGKVFISEASDGTKAIVKIIILRAESVKNEAINEAKTLQEITPLGISPEFYSFCIDTKKNYGVLIMKYLNVFTYSFKTMRLETMTLRLIFKELETKYFDTRNRFYSGDTSAKTDLDRIVELNNSLIDNLNLIINILHENGIVHYDLKPDNVLCELLPDGSYKLYLIDFGSAQRIGEKYKSVPETQHYSLMQSLIGENLSNFTGINNRSTVELDLNGYGQYFPKSFYKHYADNLYNNEHRMKVSPVANTYSLSIIKKNHSLKKIGGRKRKTRRR
jgi:serine/threonine protein kinase